MMICGERVAPLLKIAEFSPIVRPVNAEMKCSWRQAPGHVEFSCPHISSAAAIC